MSAPRSVAELEAAIVQYLKVNVLHGDPDEELDASTPLLEYGVLNSIRTAALVSYLRDDLGVDTDGVDLGPSSLRDARSLATSVLGPR